MIYYLEISSDQGTLRHKTIVAPDDDRAKTEFDHAVMGFRGRKQREYTALLYNGYYQPLAVSTFCID